MITELKVGDKVIVDGGDLIGTVQNITDEWIWVNWGLGEIWNHTDNELKKLI